MKIDMDKRMAKLVLGFIIGIIGSFLTINYSFAWTGMIDILVIAIGLVMIVGYIYLTFGWFEDRFGEGGRIGLSLVPLIVLGATIVYISLTSSEIVPPHDKVMPILGAVFIVAPSVYFWYTQRGSSEESF